MRFDAYHPMINLLFFVTVVIFAVVFRNPFFVAIGFAASFLYSSKLGGPKTFAFNSLLILFIVIWTFLYSTYQHFGATILGTNFIGNNITLESFVYGLILGAVIATVIMWFSCIHKIMTADKFTYLFGKISPYFSLFLSIILRFIPRIKSQFEKINTARQGIGKGSNQDGLFRKLKALIINLWMTLTWVIESLAELSSSMKSRGYLLKNRTAFSIYRFDHRDRLLVIVLSVCLIIIALAIGLDQTSAIYDPTIIIPKVTPVTIAFFGVYGIYCLLPMFLQIYNELSFLQSRKTGESWSTQVELV